MYKNFLTPQYFRMTVFALIAALCLSSQGCAKAQGEIEKEILAHDASFRQALDKRNRLQKELNNQKEILLKKEAQYGEEVAALKEKNDLAKKEYAQKAEEIKRRIQPEKRDLSRSLVDIQRNIKLKRHEVQIVDKDIKEINTLLKKKDTLALTHGELRTWNGRLASLIEKKEKAEKEMNKLQREVQITKLKIKVLSV